MIRHGAMRAGAGRTRGRRGGGRSGPGYTVEVEPTSLPVGAGLGGDSTERVRDKVPIFNSVQRKDDVRVP